MVVVLCIPERRPQTTQAWGREVASCLSAKRRKLQLDFVRGLIGADPKPLDVDLSRLEKWVRDTEGLNETASKVLDSTEAKAFTFDEAQDLLKAANRSLIVMPLLEDLTTAVASAEAWCAEAQGKCPLTTNFLFFSDPLSLPLSLQTSYSSARPRAPSPHSRRSPRFPSGASPSSPAGASGSAFWCRTPSRRSSPSKGKRRRLCWPSRP